MFKLLTKEEKQKVTHEYARRRTIIMLAAFTLIFLVGIIGLLPSYILSSARHNEAFERVRIMGSTGQAEDEVRLQAWLTEINRKLQVLSPKLDTNRPSDFIEEVIERQITGISLTDFLWTRAGDKTELSISGIASDRQTLVAFEDSLNASGSFSEITLPVSDLAQNKNINFQIKFLPAQTP